VKYIGIDYGAKRIGIAISDGGGTMAFPRAIIENDNQAIARIAQDVAAEKIDCLVVGDTLSYSGKRNPVTDELDEFVRRLEKETGLSVERAFEAGSSIEASRYAPEGDTHNDSVAAAVLLQRFLDMKSAAPLPDAIE
jgi:putative Holliday junction resolvase